MTEIYVKESEGVLLQRLVKEFALAVADRDMKKTTEIRVGLKLSIAEEMDLRSLDTKLTTWK